MLYNVLQGITKMSEDKASITFRTDKNTKDAIDKIAKSKQRDRSFIIKEAVAAYLDLHQWQVDHINEGIKQADEGQFVDDEQVDALFKSWQAE